MTTDSDTDYLLRTGCQQLGLELSAPHYKAFNHYSRLIQQWNKTYNLTALGSSRQIFIRHFLDSLSIHEHLAGTCSIDVGSGAGFPGLPLAIVQPEHGFTLLDSNGKRCRFLTQVKIELMLDNVRIVHGRAEEFQQGVFNQILVRAYGDISRIVADTAQLLGDRGVILAMRGAIVQSELEFVEAQGWHCRSKLLKVPHLDEERHLVTLSRM